MRRLYEELDRARPRSLEITGRTLTVRGGLLRLVPSTNPLGPITSATFEVQPVADGLIVRFHASVAELIAMGGVFSCAFTTVMVQLDKLIWEVVLVGLVMPWGWLFGMNYLFGRWSLLRMIARAAARTEAS